MGWTAVARSDRGLKRAENEDAALVRPERGLFAVADGMGGHAAGEVASRLAVETLERSVLDAVESRSAPREAARAGQLLVRAIREAHHAILDHGRREPGSAGLGTTLTALLFAAPQPAGHTFAIGHVGDSRAYRLRGGRLHRLTTDHSWVQERIDEGALSAAEAHRHPFANVLTRALGTDDGLDVDVVTGTAEPGDLLLLCSDGLTRVVDDSDLEAMLSRDLPLDVLADQAVEAANLRGGPDNITVVLIRVAA